MPVLMALGISHAAHGRLLMGIQAAVLLGMLIVLVRRGWRAAGLGIVGAVIVLGASIAGLHWGFGLAGAMPIAAAWMIPCGGSR